MVATNDDILAQLIKITNLLQGQYGNSQQYAEDIKNSSNVKLSIESVKLD